MSCPEHGISFFLPSGRPRVGTTSPRRPRSSLLWTWRDMRSTSAPQPTASRVRGCVPLSCDSVERCCLFALCDCIKHQDSIDGCVMQSCILAPCLPGEVAVKGLVNWISHCFLPSLRPGHLPDYACLIVGANMGVVGMCKEHMGVALALKVTARLLL